jgi:hypothetical protein
MAEKGKVKIIRDNAGGIILDKDGRDIEFVQRYVAELNIAVGDIVKFDRVFVDGRVIAINVVRSTVGRIESIEKDDSTGILIEKIPTVFGDSGPSIPFYQPYLSGLGIAVGDIVHYDLIRTSEGELVAVNVQEG